ncbi:MAG: glycine betaine ABC transporter substrate-binding protein [Eubacteriales bacterium]|nr:glycine betaine ABC transporter substrate-binding protein [Eubacteriales bacterium]
MNTQGLINFYEGIKEITVLIGERKDFFLELLLEHLTISLLSILIAIVLGGIAGILISEFHRSAKPTLGVINFLYTIPSISMLGFLIPFSGIGNVTAVIALTIYALLPMVRSTHTGMTNIEPAVLEAAKGMGSTQSQILFKIKLPLAMPIILAGIRNMVTMTIALAGIASFIGAGGLGVAIYRGITTNNSTMTMAGSLLIAFLALTMDVLLGFLEKRLSKRCVKAKRTNRIVAGILLIVGIVIAVFSFFSKGMQDMIRVATKPMTEQYILGEMLDIMIEQETGLKVELQQGIGGGTSNIQPAMENGEFDIYPEYTGTGWNMVLKKDGLYQETLFEQMQQEYQNKFGMKWLGMYGFNNTYGLAVRREIAEKYNLKRYSDLSKIANGLIFGAEYDFFEREDGYDALRKAYNFNFKQTVDLDIGLKYQAMAQGKIDVMVIFTTDGQLAAADIVVLEDDKAFYPSYLCGNIIRMEVLEKHPELQTVFEMLSNTIRDEDMARMNYAVESEGKEPREVATEFLIKAGLMKQD